MCNNVLDVWDLDNIFIRVRSVKWCKTKLLHEIKKSFKILL